MKRIILISISLAISSISMHAQLLWKISGNGLHKPSYIFGTHHLIPVAFLDSIPGLYKAFNESDAVVGEVVANNIETSELIRKAAIIPDKKNIKDYIPVDKYQQVDAELKSVLKIGLKDLSVMHPAVILDLYEIELFKKLTGVYDDAQSDSYFQIAAAEKDKKIIGLQTVDQQINMLFSKKDIQQEANKLTNSVLKKDSLTRELIMFNKLYKSGKLNDIDLLSQRNEKSTENTNNIKYNTDWLKQLPALMKSNSCFIAVEITHLPGNDGLIVGLQKAGYKVKPVE